VRLLDTLGVERTHVVGASFGGAVGIVFAAMRPDRVSSLAAVTVAASLPQDSDDESTRLLSAAAAAVAGGDRGAVFDAIVPTTFSEKWRTANAGLLAQRRNGITLLPSSYFEGLVGLMRSLDRLDLTPWLPSIACPVVAVAAEHDVVFPVARVREMTSAIRDAELVVVPDTGHGMLVEQPETLVAALRAFLDRVNATAQQVRNSEAPKP
jgi:pimeloyl-ACP methyl ester carboxylesterase